MVVDGAVREGGGSGTNFWTYIFHSCQCFAFRHRFMYFANMKAAKYHLKGKGCSILLDGSIELIE